MKNLRSPDYLAIRQSPENFSARRTEDALHCKQVPSSPEDFAVRIVDDVLHCEQIPLEQIAQAVGTPTYVYSASQIRTTDLKLANAFKGQRTTICYAAKANSHQAILTLLAHLGAGVDIVSGGELYRALHAGMPSNKVVFSGVGKTKDEIDAALNSHIKAIHVESAQELALVQARAAALNMAAPFALRVNPDINPHTHPYLATGLRESKFGIPISEAVSLATWASHFKHLKMVGIACHIGSQLTSFEPFLAALSHLKSLAQELQQLPHRSVSLDYIDLGGGLAIPYHGEDPQFDVHSFASQVGKIMQGCPFELLLEPGRYLIGNAGILLTRVLGYKGEFAVESQQKSFLIVDAAMNDLLRPALYDAYHMILPAHLPPVHTPLRTVDIVGPICECGDFLAQHREIPWPPGGLTPGTLMAILGTGAYGMAMASTYNSRPLPAEVLVQGSDFSLIRPRKTMADVLVDERIPEWLR